MATDLGLGWLINRLRGTRVSPLVDVGTMGTSVYGGYIDDGEKNAELTGTRKFTTYSEVLANTGIVFACVRLFLTLVGKPDWSMQPADDSAEAKKVAEFMDGVLNGMRTPFKRVVRRSSLYRIFGFSTQVWTAGPREDGAIVLTDVQVRPQKTIEQWGVTESGAVEFFVQRSPINMQEVAIPRWRTLYLVEDDLTDSPAGLGLMRGVVPAARRMERYEQLEGYGFEGDLRGIPVGRAPYLHLQKLVNQKKITLAQMERLLAPIEGFVKKHITSIKAGISVDSSVYETSDEKKTPSGAPMWGMDILKGGATSQEAVAQAIQRLELRMARLLGAEGLMLGSTSTGSFALAGDKSSTLADVVESTLGDVAAAIKADLIAPVMMLNGIPEELAPKPKPRRVLGRDVKEVAAAVRDLGAAGIQLMVEDEAVGEIFDAIGLTRPNPQLREEDAMLDPTRRGGKPAKDAAKEEDDEEEEPSGR